MPPLRRTGPAPTAERCVAVAGAALLALSGCGSATPIPVDQAVAHYEQAGQAVADALAGNGGERTREESTRRVFTQNDGCRYTAGIWSAAQPLEGVSGTDGWGPVIEAAQPSAAKAGFGDFGDPQRSGAMTSIEATDEHGAVLRIDAQGTVSVSGALVDTPTCTEESLGL